MLALSAPPTSLYPALWIGMGGLAWSLDAPIEVKPGGRFRILEGGGRGLAFGAAANIVALRFVVATVTQFTALPAAAAWTALVLLAVAQGVRWLFAGVAARWLASRGVPRWAAFAVGVYAATFVPAIFPWSPAGGVAPWPAMVQLADLVGERGVSALMGLSAGLGAHALRLALARARPSRPRVKDALRFGVIALLIPVATLVYGALRMRQVEATRAEAPTAKIALVQPSIGAAFRWDGGHEPAILETLTVLTRSAEARGAELTVWPESAYPYSVAHASRFGPIGMYAVLGRGVHGPVLTGMMMTAGRSESFNSAVLVTSNGALSPPADKRHLLAFGETVPFSREIPWLRKVFARGTGLVPGKDPVLLVAGRVRASVLNCFEDTLPEAGREAFEGGPKVSPNLLVNVTNDAWFAGSTESELHLRLSVLRAVETRRDLVRSVNLGVTSWVDATGRIRARHEGTFAGVLMAEPALLEGPATVYAQAGDAPWVIVLVGALVLALRRRAQHTRQNEKGVAP